MEDNQYIGLLIDLIPSIITLIVTFYLYNKVDANTKAKIQEVSANTLHNSTKWRDNLMRVATTEKMGTEEILIVVASVAPFYYNDEFKKYAIENNSLHIREIESIAGEIYPPNEKECGCNKDKEIEFMHDTIQFFSRKLFYFSTEKEGGHCADELYTKKCNALMRQMAQILLNIDWKVNARNRVKEDKEIAEILKKMRSDFINYLIEIFGE